MDDQWIDLAMWPEPPELKTLLEKGNAAKTPQGVLRKALEQCHGIGSDVAINTRPKTTDNAYAVLTVQEMKDLYDWRRAHVLGHNKTSKQII